MFGHNKDIETLWLETWSKRIVAKLNLLKIWIAYEERLSNVNTRHHYEFDSNILIKNQTQRRTHTSINIWNRILELFLREINTLFCWTRNAFSSIASQCSICIHINCHWSISFGSLCNVIFIPYKWQCWNRC